MAKTLQTLEFFMNLDQNWLFFEILIRIQVGKSAEAKIRKNKVNNNILPFVSFGIEFVNFNGFQAIVDCFKNQRLLFGTVS